MGQLVVKLKELRDKLELSHDKSKHVSSQGGRSEQKSLQIQDRSKSRSRDYGATAEIEAAPEEVWTKKFEMMERILENQRKFLEDHNIKIQEIENVIQKIVAETQGKDNQQDTGKEVTTIPFSFVLELSRPVIGSNVEIE